MRLVRIDRDRDRRKEQLARFDALFTYPYGNDRFALDHGDDYFAFFDRLGEVNAYAFVEGDELRGMGIAILREVPFRRGERARRVWYVCDAKTHPEHRGRKLSHRAAARRFLPTYLRCGRAYAISMNPGDGSANRVVQHTLRFRLAPVSVAGVLGIYSFDADAMREIEPLLIQHRGPVGYLSLEGKKDLIMESTKSRLPLIHVQFGPCAEPGAIEPTAGHTHMFCALEGDSLHRELEARRIAPAATATIVAHRMKRCDWQFVLTSDI